MQVFGKKTMNYKKYKHSVALMLVALLTVSGCKKKVQPAPPPPPSPPAPTASISVSPSSIQAGQSASVTWQTTNATEVSIDGIGAVGPNGSQTASLTDSTTYHLIAKGAGGTQESIARLTVTQPPPPPQPTATTVSDGDLFDKNVKDVDFDFDKSDIRADQQGLLQADAAFLTVHPNIEFVVEGHCDERGSIDYNLALGDKRAASVKAGLTNAGINADRIKTISYGKERPFCNEHDESCWQQNRRGHFVYQK
jgi:peptidoglycan-associated lipoprotein